MSQRILYVITDSGIGGSEHVLYEVLKGLNRHQCIPSGVLVLKNKREMAEKWEQQSVPVTEFGMNRWPSLNLVMKIRRSIQRVKPDIVHAFLYHSVQICRFLHMWDRSFKLVSSPRVNYRFAPRLARWLDKTTKNLDDLVLCESQSTKAYLSSVLNYDPKKLVVAQNGVQESEFQFNKNSREYLRKKWGVNPSDLCVGTIGRLHSQKGYDILIRALSHIKKSEIQHKIVIVGDGPDRDKLKALIEELSVPVLLAGSLTDIPGALSAFDIYVQSSRYEGLSNSLLEAMSVGLPIVATSVDGTLDVAQDGINMVLVKPNDPLSLSIGIGYLLEKKELRERLVQGARHSIREFSAGNMIKGFETAYHRLAS